MREGVRRGAVGSILVYRFLSGWWYYWPLVDSRPSGPCCVLLSLAALGLPPFRPSLPIIPSHHQIRRASNHVLVCGVLLLGGAAVYTYYSWDPSFRRNFNGAIIGNGIVWHSVGWLLFTIISFIMPIKSSCPCLAGCGGGSGGAASDNNSGSALVGQGRGRCRLCCCCGKNRQPSHTRQSSYDDGHTLNQSLLRPEGQ